MFKTEHSSAQGSVRQIPPVQRFARAKGACNHFQIARSTLWLWAKTRPGFPQPLKAGQKVTLFDIHAIEEFLMANAASEGANGKSY
jgi:predicted DNA-binding transcriptional regulator AlpA